MTRKIVAILCGVFFAANLYASPTNKIDLNTNQIEQLTGAKGQLDLKEKVFKVSIPRSDLKVTINGVKFTPGMGLTSWAAFQKVGDHAMVMGDLVLTEDQVNSVMSVALDNGLHVIALHNHFFWETPRVMFMHIEGMNNIEILANAVGKVFAKIKTTNDGKNNIPYAAIDPAKTTLTPFKIDAILGVKGTFKDGVYKVVIGRTGKMNNFPIGNSMGVNTWAAFVGSDELAVVDGDFAMYESELQKVLITLRHAGIYIVAIHQHMTGEQPRFMFLHYYGIGNTKMLAEGLRLALDITKNPVVD